MVHPVADDQRIAASFRQPLACRVPQVVHAEIREAPLLHDGMHSVGLLPPPPLGAEPLVSQWVVLALLIETASGRVPHRPLPDGVLELLTRPAERAHLVTLGHHVPQVHWDRLLFSAKESVYKTWFPLTRQWLDFDEAELMLDVRAGAFTASILKRATTVDGLPLTRLHGRWTVTAGLVLTAVTEPA